jgi:sugar lactone lactonase YvrE
MNKSVYVYQSSYAGGDNNTGRLLVSDSTLTNTGCTSINGITCDPSGNIYISDSNSNAIFKIYNDGRAYLYAGLPGTSGNNGANRVTCLDARFNAPSGIFCEKNGDLYVADTGNHQIRKISKMVL